MPDLYLPLFPRLNAASAVAVIQVADVEARERTSIMGPMGIHVVIPKGCHEVLAPIVAPDPCACVSIDRPNILQLDKFAPFEKGEVLLILNSRSVGEDPCAYGLGSWDVIKVAAGDEAQVSSLIREALALSRDEASDHSTRRGNETAWLRRAASCASLREVCIREVVAVGRGMGKRGTLRLDYTDAVLVERLGSLLRDLSIEEHLAGQYVRVLAARGIPSVRAWCIEELSEFVVGRRPEASSWCLEQLLDAVIDRKAKAAVGRKAESAKLAALRAPESAGRNSEAFADAARALLRIVRWDADKSKSR